MKGLSFVLVLIFILTALSSCGIANTADDLNLTPIGGDYIIDGSPLNATVEKKAKFSFESGLPGFYFIFSVPAEQYAHITYECTNVKITAIVTDNGKNEYSALVTDFGNRFGMWQFGVSVSGLFKKDYLTSFAATFSISFTDNTGKSWTHSVKSDFIALYDVAYDEYCDRNGVMTDLYPYAYGSDYSPYPDLSHHYAVLSSNVFITTSGTAATVTHENSVYQSPYNVSYFDGVLTLSMKNGSALNPDMIDKIFVNGENIYFEIHDGIIRVLLEVE